MPGLIKTLVHGLTDPRQALEAGALGVDGVVVQVGGEGPLAVDAERAQSIAAALPPLVARLAIVAAGVPLPCGYSIAVTVFEDERPADAGSHIAIVPPEIETIEFVPGDLDGLWIVSRRNHPMPHDITRVERFARKARVLLEAPDCSTGLEAALRLTQPYAVVLGEAIWFAPGICDMDKLEAAIAVVARVNKHLLR